MEDIEKQNNEKGEEVVNNPFYELMVDDYQLYMQSIGVMEDYEKLDFYIYVMKKMSRPVNVDDKYWLMAISLEDFEIVQKYLLGNLSEEKIEKPQENKTIDTNDFTHANQGQNPSLVKRIVRKFKAR